MNDQDNQQVPETEMKSKGYGKRPLWQWVLLYLVIGAVVYFVLYLLFFTGNGGDAGSGGGLY